MPRTNRTSTDSRKRACRALVRRYGEIMRLIREDGLNSSEIAARLEVSAKTIHRDLDFMRDFYGIELEFDHCEKRWICHSPEQVLVTL